MKLCREEHLCSSFQTYSVIGCNIFIILNKFTSVFHVKEPFLMTSRGFQKLVSEPTKSESTTTLGAHAKALRVWKDSA